MLENLRYFPFVFALISAVIGLLNWSKLPNYKSKLFLFTIILGAITEILGVYFTDWTGLLNYYVFNIYIIILFFIYFFIIGKILKKYKNKIISFLLICIYFIGVIISYVCHHEKFGTTILSEIYAFAVLFFIILSLLYLIELFNSSNILNYKKSIFFWFILGNLLFHVPFLPFMLSLEWFLIEYKISIYWVIIFILNLIMNSCFIIGFIWTEKKYNY